MRGKLVSALLAVVLLAAPAAYANDSALGSVGGSVRPTSGGDIRLDSETVQLVAYQRLAEVRVDFRFVNDGARRKVRLGFPFERVSEMDMIPEAGFRAWKDGRPLTVTTAEGMDGKTPVLYYVHEAEFDHGPSMLTVTYMASPSEGGITESMAKYLPDGWQDFYGTSAWYDYWVHTGANWKGPIRRSLVRFTFADDFVGYSLGREIEHTPPLDPAKVFRPDARTFQWDLRDYEPTADDDMHVPFVKPHVPYDRPGLRKKLPVAEVTASSHLKLDTMHEYFPQAVADGSAGSAWAEGAAGSGAGEWLKVTFGSPRRVREIRVVPGYQKRADLFAKYNRPKTLKVTFSDGTVSTLRLADEMGVQRFAVDAKSGWAKVEIGDVYRGTTRDETYLSDIEFSSSPAPAFATFESLMGIAPSASASSAAASATSAVEPGAAATVSPASARAQAQAVASDPRSPLLAGAAACLFLAAAVGVYLLSRRSA